jgi:hypothetical protein
LHEVADTHDTLSSPLLMPPRLGLDERDQAVPFHDRTSVRPRPGEESRRPTALHEVAETHDTSVRYAPLMTGADAIDHLVPFQDSMRGRGRAPVL